MNVVYRLLVESHTLLEFGVLEVQGPGGHHRLDLRPVLGGGGALSGLDLLPGRLLQLRSGVVPDCFIYFVSGARVR